ncbi:MAG: hypothetical protein M0Z67_02645 [Nitrospiraceae bacterium]|nr:hypothetical protein [Nitrospiraceae bacterium]
MKIGLSESAHLFCRSTVAMTVKEEKCPIASKTTKTRNVQRRRSSMWETKWNF